MNKEIFTKLSNFLVKIVAIIFFVLMGLNTLLVLTKTAIFPSDYQETLYYKQDNAILNIIFLIIFSIVILILVKYLKKIITTCTSCYDIYFYYKYFVCNITPGLCSV